MHSETVRRPGLSGLWSSYFFPTTTPVRLAVLRIIFVAAQLTVFRESLADQRHLLSADGFIEPMWWTRLLLLVFTEELLRTPAFVESLWWLTHAAGLLALIGFRTRTSMFLFGLGNLLMVSFRYSYGEVHHPEALYRILLLVFAFAPLGRCYSIDSWLGRRRDPGAWGPETTMDTATWPILLGQWMLAIAYLEAFFSKVTGGGLHWINGYTLQTYLLRDGIRFDRPLGIWFAQQPREVCMFLAASTLVFEATFILILFDRFKLVRLVRPLYFLAGLGFHVGILVTMGATFQQFILLYALWIPFDRFVGRRRAAPRSGHALGDPVPAGAA